MTSPLGCLNEIVDGVWCQALRLGSLPPNANLFQLGGDSRTAVQIAMELSELLNAEIVPADLFDAPAFDEFVDRITAIMSTAARR